MVDWLNYGRQRGRCHWGSDILYIYGSLCRSPWLQSWEVGHSRLLTESILHITSTTKFDEEQEVVTSSSSEIVPSPWALC